MIHPNVRGTEAARRGGNLYLTLAVAAWAALAGAGISAAAEETGKPLLLGVFKPEEILKITPEWKGMYDAASPSAAAIAKIREAADAAKGDLRVEVVFGSWCSDSLEQVPPFIKLLEQVGPGRLPATYVAVDRAKKDPDSRTSPLNIEKVPTFIVFRKGAEIGRIVETPKTTLEGDLAEILAPAPKP